MKTFRHSGKCGDIIFSLPTIKALGGGILYIPKNGPEVSGLYDNMKALLKQQPYIHEVKEYSSGLAYGQKAEGIHIDHDLDEARKQPDKGIVHIVKRHLDAFSVDSPNWKHPWLRVEHAFHDSNPYTLFSYTGRHIVNEQTGMRSRVNWKELFNSTEGEKYFVGTPEEHTYFIAHFGSIAYMRTNNMLELAMVVAGAEKVYCNQSSVLALAQAFGKEYWCDFKPSKMNCRLFTSNEHAL